MLSIIMSLDDLNRNDTLNHEYFHYETGEKTDIAKVAIMKNDSAYQKEDLLICSKCTTEWAAIFVGVLNSIVIENNIKYFTDSDVKKTIDNMLEHQRNERLNKFMAINYIHMLPILTRIDKLNFLHTHYNLIVVSNYFNSIKAFASINKHIFRCLKFVYEQYIPKADQTYFIDISSEDLKKELDKIKYDYFYEEYADRYRLTLMNGLYNKKLKNKVTTIQFQDDKNKMLYDCLTKFNLFMKYVTKTTFS